MADDLAELGLEGFDKFCDKDYYGIDRRAKALPKKVKNLGHSRKSSSSSNKQSNDRHYRTNSTPYEGRDDPGYADPNLRRQERDRQDPYDDDDRYSDTTPRSAPYNGPRDEYDDGWYQRNARYNDSYRGEVNRVARPRTERRSSSAGPAMKNERYANAGLDNYTPPNAMRGAIIGTRGGGRDDPYLHDRYDRGYSSDEYSDSPPPRARARSAGRSRGDSRSRRYRRDDSGSQDSRDERSVVGEKKRDNVNASAWGAIAGGLVGSEVGGRKGSPIVATFVGAGLGALGGKFIERKDRNRRKEQSIRDRRGDKR